MQNRITNQDWFNALVESVKAKVDWYLENIEHATYERAKAYATNYTAAGPEVWAKLDKLYTGDAPFNAYLKANKEARERINS